MLICNCCYNLAVKGSKATNVCVCVCVDYIIEDICRTKDVTTKQENDLKAKKTCLVLFADLLFK